MIAAWLSWLVLVSGQPCEVPLPHGCGMSFLPREQLESMRKGTTHEDGYLVTRLEADRITLVTSSGEWATYREHRVVFEVLREGGRWANQFRFELSAKTDILAVYARSLTRDGRISEVSEAEMFAATARDGKMETNTRVFRVPRVEVGSVVEWITITKDDYIDSSIGRLLGSESPTDRYQVEFYIDNQLRFDLMGRRYPATFKLEKESRFQHVGSAMANIPAWVDEPWAADGESTAPAWLFRIIDLRGGGRFLRFEDSWESALSWRAMFALGVHRDEHAFTGLGNVDFAHSDCKPNAMACLAAAWAELRRYELADADDSSVRLLKDAVAEGALTAGERAALLVKMMATAGIEAELVFAAGKRSGLFDETYPMSWPMTTMIALVHLPYQDVVVDTGCEGCAFGTVRPFLANTRAVAMKTNGCTSVEGLRATLIDLPQAGASSQVTTITTLRLGRTVGEAVMERVRTRTGMAATEFATSYRFWSGDSHQRRLTSQAEMLGEASMVTTKLDHSCIRSSCTDDIAGTGNPGDASSKDLRVLPLTALLNGWDNTTLLNPYQARRSDFLKTTPEIYADTLRITPPPGHRVLALPRPRQLDAHGLHASLEVVAEGDTVVVKRQLRIDAGPRPAAAAAAMQQFMLDYSALLREVVIFQSNGDSP